MDLTDKTQLRPEKHEPASQQEPASGGASLFVRLWTYEGPEKPLNNLASDKDPEVAELIRSLVTSSHGEITEQRPEGLVSRFSNPLYALSAAKKLQQRLLTFHGAVSPQLVSAILVSGLKEKDEEVRIDQFRAEAGPDAPVVVESDAARILVSGAIYELAKNEPGFLFNPKPVREASEGDAAQAIYELLWTDESTYGHLRDTGQSIGIHTAGRYQIQAELGRGAMGVVYKAYDKVIGRTVALKTIAINRNAPNRRELIERLKQEAKAAGGLDHPNIITIYDVGQEDDLVYLSMQFLEGKTLLTLLTEGDLPPLPTLISYADQICGAVGFAHARGVIHRDLKPANLMLTSQGVIKVLDFGIAKLDDATLTQTGLVVGTPAHMSPEQASDKKIDHRTDIFALGSVLYELFTREKPFKGDVTTILYKIVHEDPVPPSVINPALPGGIDAIIRKALAKDRKDRFQTCEEMGKALREQAALLKTATADAIRATPVAATPAPRPAPASPSYLLDTTTVRAPRRRSIPLITVLLFAITVPTGWTFYVKSRTGSFPAPAQKLVTTLQRAISRRTADGSANTEQVPSQQPAEHAGSQTPQGSAAIEPANPANAQSADSSPGSSSAANTGDVMPAQKPQDNVGTSAPSQPASGVQPSNTASPGASTPAQDGNGQVGTGNAITSKGRTSAQDATKAQSPSADGETEPTSEPNPGKPAKKSVAGEPSLKVDGFSRRDVPELLRQADAASGRGDYRMARYEYNLILKLEHNNAVARAGLRRMETAEQVGAQR
ncbi:MAG TPA: protein kinase [Candidatus Angelobacter sp.]